MLYPGVTVPPAPRDDIVSIFLTGIPDLNQPENGKPSEMIRLNTSIPPTPVGQQDRLGLLAGQNDGFPNGRRLGRRRDRHRAAGARRRYAVHPRLQQGAEQRADRRGRRERRGLPPRVPVPRDSRTRATSPSSSPRRSERVGAGSPDPVPAHNTSREAGEQNRSVGDDEEHVDDRRTHTDDGAPGGTPNPPARRTRGRHPARGGVRGGPLRAVPARGPTRSPMSREPGRARRRRSHASSARSSGAHATRARSTRSRPRTSPRPSRRRTPRTSGAPRHSSTAPTRSHPTSTARWSPVASSR